MKLEPQVQDKVVIEKQSVIPKKKDLIAKIKLHPGQKLFELDTKTGEIRIPEYEKTTISFPVNGDLTDVNSKVTSRPGCIYVTAVNLVNAKKKFQKRLNQIAPKMSLVLVCKKCGGKSVKVDYFQNPDKSIQVGIQKCTSCGAYHSIKDYFNL